MSIAAIKSSLWGEAEQVRSLLREARRSAEACGVRMAIATAYMSIPQTLEPGGWDEPELDAPGAYKRLQQLEYGFQQSARNLLGAQLEFAAGRYESALAQYRALLARLEEKGTPVVAPMALLAMAECHLALAGAEAGAEISPLLCRALAFVDSLGLEL